MRINELIVEQEIDEGLGQAIGKAWGGLARGAGAVAGGLAGTWDAAKQGYQAGKAAVAGTGTPTPPAASGTAPATGNTAQAGGAPAAGQQPAQTTSVAPATGQTAAPAAGETEPAAASSSELDRLKATLGKLNPAQKQELAGELEKSMNTPADPNKQSADATARGQQNQGFGFNRDTGVAFKSQAEKDAFLASKNQTQQAPAAGSTAPAMTPQEKNAAAAAERDKQIAATKASNAASAQADNELVAAVKAAKAKPGFQQTAQDKLTIQRGAEKGIHESKKKKKKKLVAEFNSKFLGVKI